MDKFEQQFEDLDVQTSVMENAMGTATTTSTPASQVDDLIRQVSSLGSLGIEDRHTDEIFFIFFSYYPSRIIVFFII